MEMANSMLESFGEPPKACAQIPTVARWTSKEKETHTANFSPIKSVGDPRVAKHTHTRDLPSP